MLRCYCRCCCVCICSPVLSIKIVCIQGTSRIRPGGGEFSACTIFYYNDSAGAAAVCHDDDDGGVGGGGSHAQKLSQTEKRCTSSRCNVSFISRYMVSMRQSVVPCIRERIHKHTRTTHDKHINFAGLKFIHRLCRK